MKDLALRGLPQLAISEGATSPNPGFQGVLAWSTDSGGITKWNGVNWNRIDHIPIIDWYMMADMATYVFNSGAMTIDMSTIVTSSQASPNQGETLYLENFDDDTLNGIYILGSVASLSAVPISRHPEWPVGRKIYRGQKLIVKNAPTIGPYGFLTFSLDQTLAVIPADDVINIQGPLEEGLDYSELSVAKFSSDGSMPGGITAGIWYYVRNKVMSNNIAKIELSLDNFSSTVNITSTGSGNLSVDLLYGIKVLQMILLERRGDDYEIGDALGTFTRCGHTPFQSPTVDGFSTSSDSLAFGYNSKALSGASVAIGCNSFSYGNSSVAIGYNARTIIISTESVAIGIYSSTEGYRSVAIGAYSLSSGKHSVAINAVTRNSNTTAIKRGFTHRGDTSGGGYVIGGSWHLEAQTTDATEGTAYVDTGLDAIVPSAGISVRDGFYFVTGEVVASSADNTKYAVWDVDGVVERKNFSDDPIIDFRFIPKSSSSGSQELSLKVRADAPATTGRFLFKVTGAAGTTYNWFANLRFECLETYDYSADSLPLATGKHTRNNYLWIQTSEAISAGSPVNLWNDSGTTKIRNANASNGRQADGFVAMTYGSGDMAAMFFAGDLPLLSGLTIGPIYLGTSAGTYTSSVPGTGNLVQKLGFATSSTQLAFIREPAIQT